MAEPRRFRCPWLLGVLCALCWTHVRAQTIDEVTLRPQGADMIARISFNATVRFMQIAPTTPAALYRITFDLVTADESIVNQTTEESKRVAAVGAVPEFTLS